MNSPLLKVRRYTDPCLRQQSTSVKEIGFPERMLIQSMIVTMHEAKGVGLAAPQVGVNQCFFVADIGDGLVVIVNPKILKKSGVSVLEEGCLSVPDVNIVIKRPQEVLLSYMDENNKMFEGVFKDLMARVIMHEMDHLDGKLIIDYASKEEREKFRLRSRHKII